MAQPEEVPKCHLHRKANKACKFCKGFAQFLEQQEKLKEERKHATVEHLKTSSIPGAVISANDKALVPNFQNFPKVLAERIPKTDVYIKQCASASLAELVEVLTKCENCDTERKNKITLDIQPSAFICVLYRLLTMLVTEAELAGIAGNDSPYVRCAAFMYVRLGFSFDRYWECLQEHLMDDEEFKPFMSRSGESYAMSIGEYVESLLVKTEYGASETKLPLPRIPVALRTKISRRLCLFSQFRKRYAAHFPQMERFEDEPNLDVEVCNADGEWRDAVTRSLRQPSQRLAAVLVTYPDGEQEYISLGRLIVPSASGISSDLRVSRGRSAQDLLDRHDEEQKGNAVARGKDYCKNVVQSVCVGGIRFLAGEKRYRDKRDDDEFTDEEHLRFRRRQQEDLEQKARQAAIESKYCAKVPAQESSKAPDRMRLG